MRPGVITARFAAVSGSPVPFSRIFHAACAAAEPAMKRSAAIGIYAS
jgi:hypothetical protein